MSHRGSRESRNRSCHRHAPAWNPPEFLRRWYPMYVVVAGVFALAWLLLRSGTKPSRLAYPCQQAAFSTAAAAFGGALVALVVGIRRRLTVRWFTPAGIALACVGLIAATGGWSYLNRTDAYQGPLLDPPPGYRAQVFSSTDCPQDPVGDRFICVEDLIEMMGAQGIKLHQSSTISLTAGPEGIIAADDVVVIKINYQWPERGGTNTDLLRGLIRRIVDHPDDFTGEIVVAENTQFVSDVGFDRNENNSQDPMLSPQDIVQHFLASGHDISTYSWRSIRQQNVQEYSDGDMSDGYVVYPYDSALHGRVSYPKFQTTYGTRISLKHGIWNEPGGYDRQRLKFINVPVLKSHHASYGVTAIVKNYMGVVTGELNTSSHGAIYYGLMGALIGEIQPADLNILDAIWINANPNTGPSNSYGNATRVDRLVASQDPVAGDLWAARNILIPAFIDNGFPPPWTYPNPNPDDPTSEFRNYLDNSMNYILAAGYNVTNVSSQIEAIELGPPGEASDPTGPRAPFLIAKHPDGYELTWSSPVRGGPVDEYELYRTSLVGSPQGMVSECEATLGTGPSAIVPTLPANYAFIVVARNAVGDGSFGRDSQGHDRPSAAEGSVCP